MATADHTVGHMAGAQEIPHDREWHGEIPCGCGGVASGAWLPSAAATWLGLGTTQQGARARGLHGQPSPRDSGATGKRENIGGMWCCGGPSSS